MGYKYTHVTPVKTGVQVGGLSYSGLACFNATLDSDFHRNDEM